MAQFEAINPEVEVNGQTVLSIVNGLGEMKSMGFRILKRFNIHDPETDNWYSQQEWLNAFKYFVEKVGPNTLFLIGNSIPENADFPPDIDSIEKALSSLDIAYHMNHRLNGKPLFDPANGQKKEGIGNYIFKNIDDNSAEMICNNPYPCDFDMGIIDAVAKKFTHEGSFTKIVHNEGSCRKHGDDSCGYTVSW